ncbi:MAG: T9SS type A sorting domain-containing protein [Bacteroidota bacterium]|nr:T9SS type A sorting domain-containing protein [Bacteroidota bacterium]
MKKLILAVLIFIGCSVPLLAQTTVGYVNNATSENIYLSPHYIDPWGKLLCNTSVTIKNSDGSLFDEHNQFTYSYNFPTGAPMTFISNGGTNGEIFLQAPAIYDKIKHHYWAGSSGLSVYQGYKLQTSISIPNQEFQLSAMYTKVYPSTIQVSMDGIVFANQGIQFKDPFRFVSGGQPANWDTYSGTFTPGSGNYVAYGGLHYENFTSSQARPEESFYHVKTDPSKTIDGSASNFANWTTTNGQITSPTSLETKFTLDPSIATITANYKGKLRTGRPDLSDTKNQRRLVTNGDSWVMVYESMGDIWVTTSGDGGTNWTPEVRLNSAIGGATNPTVSNFLYYNNVLPCILVAWIESNMLHFQAIELIGGSFNFPVHWGWSYYGDAIQDNNNHKALNQIPAAHAGGGPMSWTLPSYARPVVQLSQNGSNIEILVAFEKYNSGISALKMVVTDPTTSLSSAYLYAPPVGGPEVVVSTNASDQYPVIIQYSQIYGYLGGTYIFYLAGGYASGRVVAGFDYIGRQTTLLQNPNSDYTYYSLQGASSPASGTYGLVAEALSYGGYQHVVNFYSHPTYYGATIPGPSVVATNMGQPSLMFDQYSGFSTGWGGAITMKSTSDNNFYQYNGSLSQINTGASVAGIFTKEQTSYPDRTSMLVKSSTSPATIVKYAGSGLAKSDGVVKSITRAVRIVKDAGGKEQKIALDISNANVEVIDSLEHGSDVCVIKVTNWDKSFIRQVDSLIAPLSVSVKRDGKAVRSFGASLWQTVAPANLPDVRDGDIITFSLPGKTKTAGFLLVSLNGSLLPKENNDAAALIPTEKNIGVYPNPFNPTTTFRISLPESKHVQLSVYNMLGQKVATVVDDFMQAGYNDVRFDGSSLASGIYIYRMQIEKEVRSGKMMLMK